MGYVISSWTFFWLVRGEVIGSHHNQSSDYNQSEIFACGKVQFTSSAWWGHRYLQNSSKDMAQNIIWSPWGGTKDPWLCLMAKLLLFGPVWLFSFAFVFLFFSLLWLNLIFDWSFSTDKRQAEDMGEGRLFWEGCIGSCLVTSGVRLSVLSAWGYLDNTTIIRSFTAKGRSTVVGAADEYGIDGRSLWKENVLFVRACRLCSTHWQTVRGGQVLPLGPCCISTLFRHP